MSGSATPSPRAYVLGAELREARNRAGLGMRQLATKLDISHSVIVRWERGERVPSTESVSAVCAALDVSGTERDRLITMTREAEPEPINSAPAGASGERDQLTALLEFERAATAITEVSPVLVPDLLQTADYARAIFDAGDGGDAEKRVALRLGRRDVLTRRRSPVEYTAFVLESVLHQEIGGREVLADQLEFLREMRERNNVTIRAIPNGAGWTPAHAGPFVLLEFEKAAAVVHLERHRSSAFLRDEADVKAFLAARDDIDQVAMTPEDTSELIAGATDRLETAP